MLRVFAPMSLSAGEMPKCSRAEDVTTLPTVAQVRASARHCHRPTVHFFFFASLVLTVLNFLTSKYY
jgi:hypothetical protein